MTKHRSGMAILDMLIAIGLGLIILLPLTGLVRTALLFQSRQEAVFVMENDGYRLLDLIERALLQASHRNSQQSQQDTLGALSGLDNAVISGSSNALEGKTTSGVNGSDVLAVHFSVSDDDGTSVLLNCAGFSVPSNTVDGSDRGWSIFYLAPGVNGSGDLRCKYRGIDQWDSQALASGVVALQFLYGLDTDDDGLPNQFVNATTLAQIENNNVSNPNPIAAVHIALVMQSETESPALPLPEAIDLFGAFYSDVQGSHDPQVHLLLKNFPADQKKRLYRLFERVVFLRKHTTVKGSSNAIQTQNLNE